MQDNGPSEAKRMKTDEELMLGMVGRDGFFIKVTLKYGEYFHVTYRRTETQCISNDLFSGVKKFPCLLNYLEVLEVVTVAHLALFLWFYSLLRWYKKKKNNNCTMHKGNGSRVWNISCLKNESGYFIERKASFFCTANTLFSHPRNFDFEEYAQCWNVSKKCQKAIDGISNMNVFA